MTVYALIAVAIQLLTIPHAEDKMMVLRIIAWSVVWPLWIVLAVSEYFGDT